MQAFSYLLLAPEIGLLFSIALILMADSFLKEESSVLIYCLSQIALGLVAFFSISLFSMSPITLFGGQFTLDPLASFSKFLIAILGIGVFFYAKAPFFEKPSLKKSYFILALFSILGMMVLCSSRHFLSLYLGLELMILPIYALIAIRKSEEGLEAAIKYFILGGLSSALLLYGISILYGLTGTLELQEILNISARTPALMSALVFIFIAVCFKLGAVPFHLWLPDVYEGSSLAVTLLIGTLPKIAAFVLATRLFQTLIPHLPQSQSLMGTLAMLSLIIGNLGALIQTNTKRLLAYSAIAQVGFLFLCLILGQSQGFGLGLYYVLIYTLTVLALLGVLNLMAQQQSDLNAQQSGATETGSYSDCLENLKGLGGAHPCLAVALMILLLSLAGIPPFAGFYAKWFVINALIEAGHIGLSVAALLLTVIGAAYYLKIISLLFFQKSTQAQPCFSFSASHHIFLLLNVGSLLLCGIFPGFLLTFCATLFQ